MSTCPRDTCALTMKCPETPPVGLQPDAMGQLHPQNAQADGNTRRVRSTSLR
jgi:hypothetical protein